VTVPDHALPRRTGPDAYDEAMPMRVAFIAAECEPWAKTGGLADVVDALARALGRLDATEISTPVDVFLSRFRRPRSWSAPSPWRSRIRGPFPATAR
jgi:starch synthase